MKQTELEGKVALVTGSTSGIGLAIAHALARAGCQIVLNGFGEPHAIEALRQQLGTEYGVRTAFVGADVAKASECRGMVQKVHDEFGALDILLNNAGIQHVAPVEDFPIEKWDSILAINLSSAFHLTAASLPKMRRSGYGRIINIASVHGLVASIHKSAYVAAKHGLIGLTKSIALETAGQGITCNAICPGWVLTPLVEAQLNDRMRKDNIDRSEAERILLSEKQPSGAFTQPNHLGALAVFLCTENGENITGASLPIDGGWTAQ